MNLDRFLTLLATIIGLIGSIFLVKGSLGLTPDIMGRLAETNWWFNAAQVNGLATQKANAVSGAVFILLAFLIAMVRMAFVDEQIPCFESKGMAFAVAFSVAAIACVVLLFINRGVASHQKHQIGTAVIGRRVDELLRRGEVGVEQVTELAATAEKMLSLRPANPRDPEATFREVVEAVGRKLPGQFDLGKLQKDRKPPEGAATD